MSECACGGSGVILVEGPCDAAPVEAPCECLKRVKITDEMIERGACALINADALEPYDRTDGRWRPAVLAEAIIRAALSPRKGQS